MARVHGTVAAPAKAQGAPVKTTARRGLRVRFGDEVYLWVLVALELAATSFLRHKFRNAHGG